VKVNQYLDSVNRVRCEVPYCHRTMGHAVYERRFGVKPGGWICAFHWRMVPTGWKRVLSRHKREQRKYGFFPRERAYHRAWDRIYRMLGVNEGLA
jgi:hypothetical protein